MQSSIFNRLIKKASENFLDPNLDQEKVQMGNALLDKLHLLKTQDLQGSRDTNLSKNLETLSNIVSASISRDVLPKHMKDARLYQISKVVRDFKSLHTLNVNEENTINALVAPILAILGWDRSDLTSVKSEWRKTYPNGRVDTKRCDFALFASSRDPRPIALVEAKAVRERLDDTHVDQVMSYAFSANVRWAILTNGLEWRLYDTFQTGMFSKNSLVFRESMECILEYDPCHLLRLAKDNILQLDELIYSKMDQQINQDRVDTEIENLKQAELKDLDKFGEQEYLKLADKMRPISLANFVEYLVDLDLNQSHQNPIWRYCTNKESIYRDLFKYQGNVDKSIQVSVPYLSKQTAEDLFGQILKLCVLDGQSLSHILQNTKLVVYFNQAAPSFVFQEFVRLLQKHETDTLKQLNRYAKASSFLYDFDFKFELHPFVISSKLSSLDLNGIDLDSPMYLYFNDSLEMDQGINRYQPDHLYFLLWYFYLGLENLLALSVGTNDVSVLGLNEFSTVQFPISNQKKADLDAISKSWFFKKFGQSLTVAQQIETALVDHEKFVLQQHDLLGTNTFQSVTTHSSVSSILCTCCDNQFFEFFKSELSKHTNLLPYLDKSILKKVVSQIRKRKNRLVAKI